MNGQLAGAGAAEQVEQLERRLAGKQLALAGLQQEIQGIERDLQRWRAGLAGEQHVAEVLSGLAESGWVLLHDLHWPGRPKANLDHVAVGPGGVVVIDTKNWSATAAVGADGVLRAGTFRKDAASTNVVQMTADVAAMLEPQHRGAVRGALCFTGQALAPVATADGVVVLGDGELVGWLSGLSARLQPHEVAAVADYLRAQLGGPISPTVLTTAAVTAPSAVVTSWKHPARSSRRPARPAGRSTRRKTLTLVKVILVVTAALTMPAWLQPVAMAVGDVLGGVIVDVLPDAPEVPTPGTTAP